MRALSRLRSLYRNLIHRGRVDRDLDDELAAAFHAAIDERVRAGLDPVEARRLTNLELGQRDAIAAEVRQRRAGAAVDTWIQDVRYGARILRRNPLFTLTAALSLAIGIGATTTIFTIANGLLLRAAPGAADPDRLVDIVRAANGRFGLAPSSYRDYLDVRERVTVLEGVYAYQLDPEPLAFRAGAQTERVFGVLVTANYFDALGVPAAIGRVFHGADSAEPVAVLSYEFWQRRFNADPAIVGRSVQIKGEPLVISGVARESFRGVTVAAPDLWMPISTADSQAQLMMGGRLKPGVTKAQAAAEVAAAGRGLARDRRVVPDEEWSVAFSSPIPAILRGVAAAFLSILMALVSLVLLIACFNVTGVLLARATSRRREIAVRVAIGAGRARLVRQLLTETTLLFGLGAIAGVGLARGMTSLLLAALPAFPVPVNVPLPLDWRVVAFAVALSLAAAVLSGITPALHAARADVVTALKDESQGPSDRMRLRNTFVVAQVAFSILLVVTAGLLGRALGRVTAVDQGFDPHDVEAVSIDLSMAGYADAAGRQFAKQLLEQIRRLPGVLSATLADRAPGGPMRTEARRERGQPRSDSPPEAVSWNVVDTDYFRTLRIPLLAGRDFTAADLSGTQPVVIVDESTARRKWPGEDAVGKPLQDGRVVIGVSRDVKAAGGRENTAVVFYAPLQQRYAPALTILVRTSRGSQIVADLRSLVTTMNPNLPILSAHTLEESQTGPVVLQLRMAALVSGAVGVVGLLLSSIGVYGVTMYAIARRTREIGVRMTLGAQRGDLIAMVLRQGMSLVGFGAAIGLPLAAATSRVLRRLLFGLPTLDPVTFGGALVLFAAVGLAACYLPARRATRISPVDALRYE